MMLFELSISGGILILLVIVLRFFAINRLPKKVFMLLWDITLLRLLVPFYSREATSQVDMLACTFGDCREGQIPRSLLRWKFDAPSACCGVFDFPVQDNVVLNLREMARHNRNLTDISGKFIVQGKTKYVSFADTVFSQCYEV